MLPLESVSPYVQLLPRLSNCIKIKCGFLTCFYLRALQWIPAISYISVLSMLDMNKIKFVKIGLLMNTRAAASLGVEVFQLQGRNKCDCKQPPSVQAVIKSLKLLFPDKNWKHLPVQKNCFQWKKKKQPSTLFTEFSWNEPVSCVSLGWRLCSCNSRRAVSVRAETSLPPALTGCLQQQTPTQRAFRKQSWAWLSNV